MINLKFVSKNNAYIFYFTYTKHNGFCIKNG